MSRYDKVADALNGLMDSVTRLDSRMDAFGKERADATMNASSDWSVGDKVTYQKGKQERGSAVVSRVSTRANHVYIKTDEGAYLLVPVRELERR